MRLHESWHYKVDNRWHYGICDNCMRNSHEKVQMVKEKLVSGNPANSRSIEVWVCPVCGCCREL